MDKKGIKAALHVLDGDDIADVIPLEKDVITIGRDEGDVTLDDLEVSGSHCQIQFLAGNHHLFDLNSTNGTYLNGQRIVKSRLAPGDILRVGSVDFVFVIGPNAHQLPMRKSPPVQVQPEARAAPAPVSPPEPVPAPPVAVSAFPKAVPLTPPATLKFDVEPRVAAPAAVMPTPAAVVPPTAVMPMPPAAVPPPPEPVVPQPRENPAEAVPKSLETLLAIIQNERQSLLRTARIAVDFEFADGSRDRLEVKEQKVTLGRSSGVAKLERDDEISRKHASVQILPDGSLEVADLGSTNGTYLNETRISAPRKMKRGDVVRIGQSKLRVRLAF